MKKTILILLLSIATNLIAQKDTLYFKLDTIYQQNWIETTKNDAEFYRPMPLKKVGDLYQVKDYYINGNLQMKGMVTNPKNVYTYQGKITWYYKNGQKKEVENYLNNKRDGQFLTFFGDGTIKTEGTYKNDEPYDGTFNECCPYASVDTYEKGKRTASHRYYKNSKVIAKKTFIGNDKHAKEEIYYDKQGNEIGRVTMLPIDDYQNGRHIYFDIDNDKNILYVLGVQEYKNGVQEGLSEWFDSKGNSIAKGTYKNGNPYVGTFYWDDRIETYKNGILEGDEIAYSKDQIVAEGINKNGQHWEGQFKTLDTQISTYKNGQLDGKQTTYYTDSFRYELKGIKSYHHIKNNKKEGESAYFDKEGKELAKGIYKEDKPWNGTFYNDYFNTLESYNEGKKHGFFIQYNNNGKLIAKQEYDEGKISGKVNSKGYFKDRTCSCIYKKGEPFQGNVCEDLSVLTYENGKIVKRKTYKREAQNIVEEEQYYNEKGEVAKKITYNKGKKHILTYKNGKPDNGQTYSEYSHTLLTYKEGHLNGYFTELTYENVFIEGNYKDDSWDGIIHFSDNLSDKKTSCVYENDKPINGTVIKNNCITTYKNGLKSGLELCKDNLFFKINNDYQLMYDSITQNYKKGELDGKIQYFKNGKLINQGLYEQNHKIEGTFYVNKIFQNLYKNAKLVESTYYVDKYRIVDVYKNSLITKETTFKKGKVIYEGDFKNGEANNGVFITIDNKEEPRRLTITHFKNGKKQGEERTVNFIENTVEKINRYKNGVIQHQMKRFHFKNKDSIVGVYKKGKPFKGHFYSVKGSIEKIEQYKKGIKTGYQYYYSTTGSLLKKPLDSISYINGKPFDGIEIEVVNIDYHKCFYKNGKETQIDVYNLYYQGITDLPLYRVTPTNTGFTTKKSNKGSFKKYNELTYTNADKTEGKVVFYGEGENGYLQFKNSTLTDIQIKLKVPDISISMYLEKPNILLADAKSGDLRIKIYPDFKLSPKPSYKDFLDINKLFFKGSGTTYFYVNDKLLSTCTIKKGRGSNGIVIKQMKNGKFIYRKYQNGEPVETRKRLTKQELITLIAKQKNKP